jgi:hypothetical protein
VDAAQAADFVAQGYAAYVYGLQTGVAGLSTLVNDIGVSLGIPYGGVTFEAFVARAGAISSAHYDHDSNFQILLSGKKRWRIAPNAHIRNPMEAYHPRRLREGGVGGFEEEAYAHRLPVPSSLPPDANTEFVTEQGSVVFLPRGYWHEVDTIEDSFAVNVVVKGVPWARALARALLPYLIVQFAVLLLVLFVPTIVWHSNPELSASAAKQEQLSDEEVKKLFELHRLESEKETR